MVQKSYLTSDKYIKVRKLFYYQLGNHSVQQLFIKVEAIICYLHLSRRIMWVQRTTRIKYIARFLTRIVTKHYVALFGETGSYFFGEPFGLNWYFILVKWFSEVKRIFITNLINSQITFKKWVFLSREVRSKYTIWTSAHLEVK